MSPVCVIIRPQIHTALMMSIVAMMNERNMSGSISVCHGPFGRVGLFRLDRRLAAHAHRESHLIFHLEGEPGETLINGTSYQLNTDTCIAVNPLELHSFVPNETSTSCIRLMMLISPNWILETSGLTAGTIRFGHREIRITPRLRRLVDRLAKLLRKNEAPHLFHDAVYNIYLHCYRQSWVNLKLDPVTLNSLIAMAGPRIIHSLEILEENFKSDIDMNTIARRIGMSRQHFFAQFKEQVGVSPNVYINTLRAEYAVHALVTTEQPLEDIAFELGFSCQSSFSRFFSSTLGIPPSIYRRGEHATQ